MSAANGAAPSAAAAAAAANPFQYQTRLLQVINSLTVVQIKSLIKNLNTRVGCNIRLAGNKPVLLQRLEELVNAAFTARDALKYDMIRVTLGEEVFRYQTTDKPDWAKSATYAGTSNGIKAGGPPLPSYGAGAGPSRFGGLPPPAAAAAAAPPPLQPPSYNSAATHTIARPKFATSPFYSIHEWLSGPITVPEAHGNERKISRLQFSFTRAQRELMTSNPDRYACRLFIATGTQWDNSIRTQAQCYVDFPFGSDVQINGVRYTANLKGNKKNPGRVPPPDLNAANALFLQEGRLNTVTLAYYADKAMYATHVGRHIMAVALCKLVTPIELVEKLGLERSRSKEAVLAAMRARKDDDEIEAGAQTFRLKDPLSFMSISTPIRSSTCPHVQVFDALIFLSMNEQTPTWQCPVCSQDIKWEHLFVDGFAKDIMKRVPASCDKVLVETDGEWRTEDGKMTSKSNEAPLPAAIAAASSSAAAAAPAPVPSGSSSPARAPVAAAKQEIVVLDDSPSPPRRPVHKSAAAVARRAAPSRSSNSGMAPTDAIDLTLSSDEEDDEDAPLVERARGTKSRTPEADARSRAQPFASPPLEESATPVTPSRAGDANTPRAAAAAAVPQTSSSAASAQVAGARSLNGASSSSSGTGIGASRSLAPSTRSFGRTSSHARLEATMAAAEAAALRQEQGEAPVSSSPRGARRPRQDDEPQEGVARAEKRARGNDDDEEERDGNDSANGNARVGDEMRLVGRSADDLDEEEGDEDDEDERDEEEDIDSMDEIEERMNRSSEEWSDYPFGRRRVWSGVPGVRQRKLRKDIFGNFIREREYDSELDEDEEEEDEYY